MVIWPVDYLKVSHLDIFKIATVSVYLSSIYGGLIVHRGKVHGDLGMYLDHSKKGAVKLCMIKYLDILLQ